MKAIVFVLAALVLSPLMCHAELVMPFHGERHLLGAGKAKEGEFPEGSEGWELFLEFAGKANDGPATLEVRHRDVVTPFWKVVLNGTDLGWLTVGKGEGMTYFELPKEALRNGSNILQLRGVDGHRRGLIVAGPFLLHEGGLDGGARARGWPRWQCADRASGKPVPARITIIDAEGEPARDPRGRVPAHRGARRGALYPGQAPLNWPWRRAATGSLPHAGWSGVVPRARWRSRTRAWSGSLSS